MNQRPVLFRSEGRGQTKGTKQIKKIKIQRTLFHYLFHKMFILESCDRSARPTFKMSKF